MTCDGRSEKKYHCIYWFLLSPSDQESNQTKINSENLPPWQSHILSAIHKIRKSDNHADV